MLKKQMEKHIENLLEKQVNDEKQIALFPLEKAYVEKHQFVNNEVTIVEDMSRSRFEQLYMERCDKETENLLAIENTSFMDQSIQYLKQHQNEFIYVESEYFDLIDVEAISLEVDDVFGTYDVMLGYKVQKKYESQIKGYLTETLVGDEIKFDLMFSQADGLWDLNFTLNCVEGFSEEMTIREAYELIYTFIFQLSESLEA